MIRSAPLFALLLILASAPLEAQVATPVARTHTVLPGETLGAIARDHFGSATRWQEIWEVNRDRLSDPDRLQVGMELRLPGATPASEAAAAAVAAPSGAGTAVGVVESFPYEDRRALLEARPFVPGAPSEVDRDLRTVFFETRERAPEGPMVLVQDAAEVPAVAPGVFHAAGWIVGEGEESGSVGRIVAIAEDARGSGGGVSLRPFDRVVLSMAGASPPREGETFLAFHLGEPVPGVGAVARPSGILRVVEVEASRAVAEIVEAFDPVRVGQHLTLPRTFPLRPGVHPSDSDAGTRAALLAFQAVKAVHFPGDFAFVDRGRTDGLAVGDEFVGLAPDGASGFEREAARFQVVGLDEGTATVRILTVESPEAVRPGLALVLDRKMP